MNFRMKRIHLQTAGMAHRLLLTLVLLLGLSKAQTVSESSSSDSLFQTKGIGIKINPFMLLSGNLPVYAEFRLAPNFSLEFSGGITGKDLFFELGRGINDPEFTTQTFADPGFSVQISPRYFYSARHSALKGGYFAPVLEYRHYRAIVSTCNDPLDLAPQNLFLPESRNRFYFKTVFGYQTYSRGHFITDMYFGVGMRYRSSNVVRCEIRPGVGEVPSVVNETALSPVISAGIKLGFGI